MARLDGSLMRQLGFFVTGVAFAAMIVGTVRLFRLLPNEQASLLATLLQRVTQLEGRVSVCSRSTATPAVTPDLVQRMARLEDAITNDPSKALAIPMLRRDVEELRGRMDTLRVTMAADTDRVYDLMKWLVGTIALAFGGMALSVLRPRPNAETK